MEKILAAGKIRHKFAVRIQTVLHRAGGKGTSEIVKLPGIHPMTARLYVRCYNQGGIDALVRDKTRKPGKTPCRKKRSRRYAGQCAGRNCGMKHLGAPAD